LELGKAFAFVARQQRISTESKDFYLDLVFYNYLIKCFVLFELKTGELTHQDIGQRDMYVRMYDEQRRGPEDNPTVGIITVCPEGCSNTQAKGKEKRERSGKKQGKELKAATELAIRFQNSFCSSKTRSNEPR
jgi:hypothetical protein